MFKMPCKMYLIGGEKLNEKKRKCMEAAENYPFK
jgi:hypothetical protein